MCHMSPLAIYNSSVGCCNEIYIKFDQYCELSDKYLPFKIKGCSNSRIPVCFSPFKEFIRRRNLNERYAREYAATYNRTKLILLWGRHNSHIIHRYECVDNISRRYSNSKVTIATFLLLSNKWFKTYCDIIYWRKTGNNSTSRKKLEWSYVTLRA